MRNHEALKRIARRLGASPEPALSGRGKGSRSERFGPGDEEIVSFERQHAIGLPDEYRSFLLELGMANTGLVPLSAAVPAGASLARPFPFERPSTLRPGGKRSKFEHVTLPPGTSVHDGCLYLVDRGCGSYDLLVVTGPQRGAVWASDCDDHIYPVGSSFLSYFEELLEEDG